MDSNDDSFAKHSGHRHHRRHAQPDRLHRVTDAGRSSGGPSASDFAEPAKRLDTHPLENALLCLVLAHLMFLPWALGTMVLWAQQISLALATASFVLALVPREYSAEQTGMQAFRMVPWRRLIRFPLFWLGLALLALVICHALNPSWEYRTNGQGWWMQAIPHLTWLPNGVRVPFRMWGPWRMLMIYSSAWMTVCAIWIGFTRRRTLRRFFIALALNGLALALVGFVMRFTGATKLVWIAAPPPGGSSFFSSFIYKNHAGAYLDLVIAVTCALCGWYYLRGVRRLEKSNPAAIFALFAIVLAFAVVVSAARGATLTMVAYLAIAAITLVIHQAFFASAMAKRPVLALALVVLAAISIPPAFNAVDTQEAVERIRTGFANGGDYSLRSRIAATDASADMLKASWPLGAGIGSFRFIFPLYQQNYPEILTVPGTTYRQFWEHAHNDWMEIPVEFGVPGLLLVALSFGWIFRALVRRKAWRNPCVAFMVLGLVAVACYARWDFPFQCPAILITWSALWPASILWAQKEDR